CLYPSLRWGYTQMSSMSLKPPVSAARSRSLQSGLNSLLKEDAPGCPAKFNETSVDWLYMQHQYPVKPAGKMRVLALIDNFCGSDCEGAIEVIAAISGSVIAGVNTFGVAQFIQSGYFVLLYTRLFFRIVLGMADGYGDDRSFDGYG